jgi:hypothetical protein
LDGAGGFEGREGDVVARVLDEPPGGVTLIVVAGIDGTVGLLAGGDTLIVVPPSSSL